MLFFPSLRSVAHLASFADTRTYTHIKGEPNTCDKSRSLRGNLVSSHYHAPGESVDVLPATPSIHTPLLYNDNTMKHHLKPSSFSLVHKKAQVFFFF